MSKETIVSEDQIEASPEVAADVEAVTESDQVADVAARRLDDVVAAEVAGDLGRLGRRLD